MLLYKDTPVIIGDRVRAYQLHGGRYLFGVGDLGDGVWVVREKSRYTDSTAQVEIQWDDGQEGWAGMFREVILEEPTDRIFTSCNSRMPAFSGVVLRIGGDIHAI
jgi:hypothetical protein